MPQIRWTASAPALIVALLLAGCGSSSDNDESGSDTAGSGEVQTIATTIPFPPYTDQVDGEFVGIEKDLITEIAGAAGFKIKIVNVPKFEALIPGMLSGRYDAAYDAFGDNPVRHEQFKTVDWLGYRWGLAGPKGKFSDGSELCGKHVAVQAGSQVMIDALKAYSDEACGSDPIDQVELPIGQQTSAVKSGRADAMVTDTISLPGVLEKTPSFAPVGDPYGTPVLGGLLVPAKNEALANQVVQGLKKIIADGTYEEIMRKWEVADAAYKKATVNAGE